MIVNSPKKNFFEKKKNRKLESASDNADQKKENKRAEEIAANSRALQIKKHSSSGISLFYPLKNAFNGCLSWLNSLKKTKKTHRGSRGWQDPCCPLPSVGWGHPPSTPEKENKINKYVKIVRRQPFPEPEPSSSWNKWREERSGYHIRDIAEASGLRSRSLDGQVLAPAKSSWEILAMLKDREGQGKRENNLGGKFCILGEIWGDNKNIWAHRRACAMKLLTTRPSSMFMRGP